MLVDVVVQKVEEGIGNRLSIFPFEIVSGHVTTSLPPDSKRYNYLFERSRCSVILSRTSARFVPSYRTMFG